MSSEKRLNLSSLGVAIFVVALMFGLLSTSYRLVGRRYVAANPLADTISSTSESALTGWTEQYLPRNLALAGEALSDSKKITPQPTTPARLLIPAINVDTSIVPVGLTANGVMDITKRLDEVAWYKPGTRPGEAGSAVIAGHYGLQNGVPAVFDDLNKLNIGDVAIVVDDAGQSRSFIVREMRRYNPQDEASAVFGSIDGGVHLNIITCDGVWDDTTKSYSQRLVVFTDLVSE